ncbi:hypothetical protein, partial [Enterococcus faecium]
LQPPVTNFRAFPCGTITPNGIVGTPTIDPATGTLYLNAREAIAGDVPRHRVYALNTADGTVRAGWPIDTQPALAVRGQAFDSSAQGARSALMF